jgi:hypothetical protein
MAWNYGNTRRRNTDAFAAFTGILAEVLSAEFGQVNQLVPRPEVRLFV